MDRLDILKNIPERGLIKKSESSSLSKEQKAVLNRKGNIFFNEGRFDLARRIFITTGYTDGLIRLGDRYLSRGDAADAFEMYQLAPAPEKVEFLVERMSIIIKTWLNER